MPDLTPDASAVSFTTTVRSATTAPFDANRCQVYLLLVARVRDVNKGPLLRWVDQLAVAVSVRMLGLPLLAGRFRVTHLLADLEPAVHHFIPGSVTRIPAPARAQRILEHRVRLGEYIVLRNPLRRLPQDSRGRPPPLQGVLHARPKPLSCRGTQDFDEKGAVMVGLSVSTMRTTRDSFSTCWGDAAYRPAMSSPVTPVGSTMCAARKAHSISWVTGSSFVLCPSCSMSSFCAYTDMVCTTNSTPDALRVSRVSCASLKRARFCSSVNPGRRASSSRRSMTASRSVRPYRTHAFRVGWKPAIHPAKSNFSGLAASPVRSSTSTSVICDVSVMAVPFAAVKRCGGYGRGPDRKRPPTLPAEPPQREAYQAPTV
nr:MAG TPA: hypothetical protein [Caudoviricetes sp.]